MREIADEVGATFMVDMAHFAGLVAGKVLTGDFDPVPHAHIVTTTTHKSLRGPRGGMVLCHRELAEHVDRGCPMVLGGPLPHVMAAKAVALAEARSRELPRLRAARSSTTRGRSPTACCAAARTLVTGGTDNHLVLIDVLPLRPHRPAGRGGAARRGHRHQPQRRSRSDPNGAWYTSGIRLGTPALTTRGLGAAEMDEIAGLSTPC